MSQPPPKDRVDKWLWQARFFKTRGLASDLAKSVKLRVDGEPITKASRLVGPGVVLTFPQGARVRVVRILALALRRGPASEAQALYEDLSEPSEATAPRAGPRPTKRDRRKLSQRLE